MPAEGVAFEGELADGLFVQVQGPAQVGVLLPQAPQLLWVRSLLAGEGPSRSRAVAAQGWK
nr:hypothetical protein OG409_37555 [Streptomyces sp. NBC_00974]